jgi:hypothetical protein
VGGGGGQVEAVGLLEGGWAFAAVEELGREPSS